MAACRQLVGIGDRSVAVSAEAGADGGTNPPPCGLAFPEGDCRTCMERSCCVAASTCAGSPGCAKNEECVAACDASEDCVQQCQRTDPAGTVPSVPALDTCLASECANACGILCGAHAAFVASPDASAPCETCVAANACTAAQSCGSNLACETLYRCEIACRTLDCAIACESDDAGTQLFNAYGADLLSNCASACGLGQNWVCVGSFSWPAPKATVLSVSVVVADVYSSAPTSGADVKLCAQADPGCLHPLDDQTTDATGAVTLHYSLTNEVQGGFVGYLLTTSSAIAPSLFFWGFPLSEPSASFGFKVSTLGLTSLGPFLAALGSSQVEGHGMAFVGAFDCSHNPAVGVQITILSGADANTKTFYGVSGGLGFSAAATATDSSGVTLLTNLPAGPVTVEVTNGAGLPVSQESFLVVDGGAEEIVALPTPM